MFEYAHFIEYPQKFEPYPQAETDIAPIFKKQFDLALKPQTATVSFVCLGLGYVYLNGKPVTEDKFLSPFGDYRKTLWYNSYDVAELLHGGTNEIAVITGNGFYNEYLKTGWDFDKAPWRGAPKMILQLDTPEKQIVTDESWVTSREASPVVYNQIRSGEVYDCRIGENFGKFGIGGYVPVKISDAPPTGVFRECRCQPIREFESYSPIKVFTNAKGRRVYDFGQNISGYVKIVLSGNRGDTVTLRHGERIFPDGTLDHRGMDGPPFHLGHEFQFNRIILSGKTDTPEIRFTYHGFRYVEIDGNAEITELKSVFVHQDVKKVYDFNSSEELLNKICHCSDHSVWSNMFYLLTDCPTREKLGWTNDAVASAEQILMNFDSLPFFEKWLTDIFDAVTPDGNIPSIVPTGGWGLTECTGPLCTGIIFELPFKMYEASANAEYIRKAYPYMAKHLEFLVSKINSDGLIAYGLGDWNGGGDDVSFTPVEFVETALVLKYAEMTVKAAELFGLQNDFASAAYTRLYNRFTSKYYDSQSGRCTVNTQTAVAMMICLFDYGSSSALSSQLSECIAESDFHIDCGMVGLQYLIPALDIIDRNDLAYRLLAAKGYPSYSCWIEDGATTLYEMWNMKKSANHHMNSSALTFFMNKLVGLSRAKGSVGYKKLAVRPYFPDGMTFCSGRLPTAEASWVKNGDTVIYTLKLYNSAEAEVFAPTGYTASFTGKLTDVDSVITFKKAKEFN